MIRTNYTTNIFEKYLRSVIPDKYYGQHSRQNAVNLYEFIALLCILKASI